MITIFNDFIIYIWLRFLLPLYVKIAACLIVLCNKNFTITYINKNGIIYNEKYNIDAEKFVHVSQTLHDYSMNNYYREFLITREQNVNEILEKIEVPTDNLYN